MKATRQAALLTLWVLAGSTSPLWAQPSAVHAGPRYVEAADLTYGPAIAKARAILHARMDEFPGLSVAVGMRHTSADQNRFIEFDRVRPYVVDDEGRFANAPYVDNSFKWAGGGFLSTAEDLVRFGLAHTEAGFLEAETLTMLHTSQKTKDGQETGYGVGWLVGADGRGRRSVGHGGGSVGGTTVLWIYPEQGLVIAMVTNLSDGPAFPTEEIVDLFLD